MKRIQGRVLLMALAASALSAGTALARPDMTGVWMMRFEVHASGVPMSEGASPWMAVSRGDPALVKLPTIEESTARIDALVKANNGVPVAPGGGGPNQPLTEAGKAAFAKVDHKELVAKELACYPTNVMSRVGASPLQVVQNDKAVALISESGPARTIHLDKRDHGDGLPQWNGHSIGRWDGEVLKVETTLIRGGMWGNQGLPLSEDAKLTEEYSVSADGKELTVRATLTDPVNYTEPLRRIVRLKKRTDVEVLDYNCLEGAEDQIMASLKK